MRTLKILLFELEACDEAKDWTKKMTIEEALKKCQLADWILWIAEAVNVDIRLLTLAKGLCANTVRHLMTDERSINAVDAAIRFGKGEIDARELKFFFNSALYAYIKTERNSLENYAAYAAYASTGFTRAYYMAAYASECFTDPVTNVANQLETAEICREVLGTLIINNVNKLLK